MAKISDRVGLSWVWVVVTLIVHAGISLLGLYSLAFFTLGRLGGLSTPPPRVLLEYATYTLLFGPAVCAVLAVGAFVFGRKRLFLTFAFLPLIYTLLYVALATIAP